MKKIFIIVLILFFGLSSFADNCVLTELINGNNIQTCKTISGNKKCFISKIGNENIDYRFDGKINHIGDKNVYYQNGKISKIGDEHITYRFDGVISEIGNRKVYYKNDKIIKIGDETIDYRFDGIVNKIGDKNVYYQFIED